MNSQKHLTPSVLELRDATAGYGQAPVLCDVSLHIEQGESVAIIGANGAGKSTLVRAIAGLLPLTAGVVTKAGNDISASPAHLRAREGIAVVLEGRRLFGELSIKNHLDLSLAHSQARAQRFALNDVLGMFAFMRERLDTPVELLSGGEQQMVAVARALLLQPDLLVMDEPSTGLAPKVVNDIVAVVNALRRGGMSILLVEQNAALAARTTDRAYVMSLGRVVHEVGVGEWQSFLGDEKLARSYLAG
jgi:ABC-type branched-subunit amino acid transport system ATPase component